MKYALTDKRGNLVLMRDGKPFTYSSVPLAMLAKRLLQNKLEQGLRMVDFDRTTP